jgi:hypothetical protein
LAKNDQLLLCLRQKFRALDASASEKLCALPSSSPVCIISDFIALDRFLTGVEVSSSTVDVLDATLAAFSTSFIEVATVAFAASSSDLAPDILLAACPRFVAN